MYFEGVDSNMNSEVLICAQAEFTLLQIFFLAEEQGFP